ncbi:MAG: arginine--tRNA ligase [Candidatus Omnitrophota bacterium]
MIERQILSLIDQTLKGMERFKGLYAGDSLRLEIPKDPSHGDLSSNISFKLAKALKANPNEIAQEVSFSIRNNLGSSKLKDRIGEVEALNGFINFRFTPKCLREILGEIKEEKGRFGCCRSGRGKSVQVEFVSANPTGPLSIAHARQAAFGDSLANVLRSCGFKVSREYYVNDEGVQISLLGKSIYARYKEILNERCEFPSEGYKGEYIIGIANETYKRYGKKYAEETEANLKFFSDYGVKHLLKEIKDELSDFDVKFDRWYKQSSLAKSGSIEKTLKILEDKGLLYEKEGAIWFKSTAFGDDKDRVVKKSDGAYTYIAPDIAYHKDKFKRGFDKVIDIWGPDHHGYISRMRAAVQALGFADERISIIIIQLATLYKNGKPIPMSTRAGEYVTLREVLDEVGKDAARFFFLMRKASAHLDFDLELAKRQTPENPVYYVQYAHARICSISEFKGGKRIGAAKETDLELLKADEELQLLRQLRQFPMAVRLSAQELEPYRIILYLQNLATSFHKFYEAHRVVSDDLALTRARLLLVYCVRQVLANSLSLLGVSCPKKM